MKKTMADLVLISITAAWGSSFILMKNVADTVSPLAFLTLRFGVASLLLLIMFFKERKRYTKDMLLKGMVLGFLVTLSMTLQFVGLKYTTPTNSAFITSLSVVFVPILSSIVLKKAPNMSNIAG
ncbi:MAG: DMT family transporter, partial [Clostridiaceae bacterium]|nr:DMT family transporter [Clostridiaceae bacterium]